MFGSLMSTDLNASATTICVAQGYVHSRIHNRLLLVDSTGPVIVKHERGSMLDVEGVSIHFNGGITVSTNRAFYPVVNLGAASTIRRCRSVQPVSLTPFLLNSVADLRGPNEGFSMLLHVEVRQAPVGVTQVGCMAINRAGEAFVLTLYNENMELRLQEGFYHVMNIRRSIPKSNGKVYYYSDSANGSTFFPSTDTFEVPTTVNRVDLPQSKTVQSILEAYEKNDPHAFFNFERATVTGISYTQPTQTQAKRFQRVHFFLGTGGHVSMLTIFEQSMFIPETTKVFSANYVKQNYFQTQLHFQSSDATEIIVVAHGRGQCTTSVIPVAVQSKAAVNLEALHEAEDL
jgi:hypothetical protein